MQEIKEGFVPVRTAARVGAPREVLAMVRDELAAAREALARNELDVDLARDGSMVILLKQVCERGEKG